MQVSKRLVVRKEIPIDNSKDLISSMDVAMAEYYCQNNNYERGLELFREAIAEITDEAERNFVTNKYIGQAIKYAQKLSIDKKYIEAIEQYRNIMKHTGFPINIYKNIGLCMKSIGNADLAIKFLKRFEEISPDKVVEQTIIARQKSLWDQYFLYFDVEAMLQRNASAKRRYASSSADERAKMLKNYKADLMQSRIDNDIVAVPEKFEIEKTVYSKTEGTVTVTEWFKYPNYREKKSYVYKVRQREGIWQIYDYTVTNLGTE